jgi:diguanylate cyclase (GGDEF)-like protein
MTQRAKSGVVRISRGDVSGRVSREEQVKAAVAVPTGLIVIIHGSDAGVQYELHDHALTIGRENTADLHLSDPAAADAHARLTYEHGQWVLHDLGSEPGTFVNNERVSEYVLRDGDRIRIGRSILKLLASGDLEKRAIDELFRVENLDGLTQASNSDTFMAMVQRDVLHARRYGRPLSLIWLDVDGFRRLNASHGEPMGNLVLQQLTTRLRGMLRKQDFLARVSDDEFAILMPATSIEEAEQTAEKLRVAVEAEQLKFGTLALRVTVSGGVTTLSGDEDGRLIVERAKQGMSEAQAAGGNRLLVRRPEFLAAPKPASEKDLTPLDDDED